ncbi:MAG: NAD(P)-dependent oxidoreductase [Rhodospirillales bacterium]|nr:NAD(P)-dependent oxidoreductase [Rhodospirillales bacterium]MBO6787890.1 NAD(P)-dependent oxidoreductase [Rhodospirillales bacterium]
MNNERTTIGVAGCGAMGLPMAENLLSSGFDVWGFDVLPVSASDNLMNRMVGDADAFAAKAGTVISVVRDIAETNALLFDEQAIMMGENHPRTLVLSSTLSPRFIQDVAARVPDGITVIDAPMSGAPYRARDGSLTFMVGGDADAVQLLMPAFEAMGETVHHLGPVGAGAACKVANNLCAAAGVVAVRRALKAAAAYGIDAPKLLEVMRTSSGATWYGDNLQKIDWAGEGYEPGNTMGILEKDVKSFVDALGGLDDIEAGAFEDAIIEEIRAMEPLT